MTPIYVTIFMVFGALVALLGLALLFFQSSQHRQEDGYEQGKNRLKVLGMEFEFATPPLAVFLVGSAIFVLPILVPPKQVSLTRGQQSPPPQEQKPADYPNQTVPQPAPNARK